MPMCSYKNSQLWIVLGNAVVEGNMFAYENINLPAVAGFMLRGR